MKKVLITIVLAIGAFFAFTLNTSAAPESTKSKNSGPFEGNFAGTLRGDKGSKAGISLALSQSGDDIEGAVTLGSGLIVDGGFCGQGYVPAGSYLANGESSGKDPKHMEAQTSFKLKGMKIKILMDGDLSTSGNVLNTKAKVDLPWICGRDPVVSGTLFKT